MARNKPFMFDYSFDDGADENRQAEIEARRRAMEEAEANRPPTFSVEELETAKTEAHAAGRQEGMADAMAGIEQQVARTLDAVFSRVPKVFEQHHAWTQTLEADALRLAHTVMRKVSPELVREHELPEVEHVIREAFSFLTEQPKVMIRVAAELESALSEKVNLMASRVGYEGQVVLVGDPELAIDDCRVSWQAGAVERGLDDTWGQIDEIVNRTLASQQNRHSDNTSTRPTATPDQATEDAGQNTPDAPTDDPVADSSEAPTGPAAAPETTDPAPDEANDAQAGTTGADGSEAPSSDTPLSDIPAPDASTPEASKRDASMIDTADTPDSVDPDAET